MKDKTPKRPDLPRVTYPKLPQLPRPQVTPAGRVPEGPAAPARHAPPVHGEPGASRLLPRPPLPPEPQQPARHPLPAAPAPRAHTSHGEQGGTFRPPTHTPPRIPRMPHATHATHVTHTNAPMAPPEPAATDGDDKGKGGGVFSLAAVLPGNPDAIADPEIGQLPRLPVPNVPPVSRLHSAGPISPGDVGSPSGVPTFAAGPAPAPLAWEMGPFRPPPAPMELETL